MSAVYGSAVFGGIGEQQVGINGAIAQQLPPHIEGTFALKGGRRSQRNRRSQRKSQRRRGGKSQRKKKSKQSKRRQQKGGN